MEKDEKDCLSCCVPLARIKTKVSVFTWISSIMLLAFVSGGAWTIFAEEKTHPIPAEQMVKDSKQDSDIEHNRQQNETILSGQKDIVRALGDFREVQIEVITTLRQLEKD